MIYTNKVRLAMRIAYEAHKNQFDRGGVPYILHPVHIAEQMKTEEMTITALLHDVVEDTDVTFEELIKAGFSENVITALRLLTRDEKTDYFEYINNMKENEIARTVKKADLEHNGDISRLETVKEEDIGRVKRYEEALKLLKTTG